MVFYTGDPHGDVAEIVEFCRQMRLQPADTLVILGDVGANYYLNKRDLHVKEPERKICKSNHLHNNRQ